MVRYGYTSTTNERIYHTYVCECCGNDLGSIEIIFDGVHMKERDDLAGWNFCPYCGNILWNEISGGKLL